MTTPDLTPLLVIRVLGIPRPKGSMKPFVVPSGQPRMREQHGHSTSWRADVAAAAYTAIRCGCGDPGCTTLQARYPYDGPVALGVDLEFVRPKSARSGALPSTRSTGDIEKHIRNICDALQDARVITDDARVVDLRTSKRYTDAAPGADITVWPVAAVVPKESGTPGRDATPARGAGAQVSVP